MIKKNISIFLFKGIEHFMETSFYMIDLSSNGSLKLSILLNIFQKFKGGYLIILSAKVSTFLV